MLKLANQLTSYFAIQGSSEKKKKKEKRKERRTERKWKVHEDTGGSQART